MEYAIADERTAALALNSTQGPRLCGLAKNENGRNGNPSVLLSPGNQPRDHGASGWIVEINPVRSTVGFYSARIMPSERTRDAPPSRISIPATDLPPLAEGSGLGVVSHDQIGETMEGLFGGIRMDRCQRTSVARVEGIKQGLRYNLWNLRSVPRYCRTKRA
jgi:hypothetical protein